MASLISWLGQKAKAVEAQVNPSDNGATYNTVVNNRPPNQLPNLQNARYGVLANNPQAQQNLIRNSAPSSSNPIASGIKQAAGFPARLDKSIYNNILKPLPGAFINTAKILPDASSAGADLVRSTLNPTDQNKQNLAFSQRALSNAYQSSIPNSMITPAWHATQAVEQTPAGNPIWQAYNKIQQNKKNQAATQADQQAQSAIQQIQQGVKTGKISPADAAQAIDQASKYSQAYSQNKEVGYNRAFVNAGFNPNDSPATVGRKFSSNAGQTVLNAATLGAATEAQPAETAAGRVLNAANNSGKFMAAANTVGALGADKLTTKDIIKAPVTGYLQGAVLGAALHPVDMVKATGDAGNAVSALADTLKSGGIKSRFADIAGKYIQNQSAVQGAVLSRANEKSRLGMDALNKAEAQAKFSATNLPSNQKLLAAPKQNFTMPNADNLRIANGTEQLAKEYQQQYDKLAQTWGGSKRLQAEVDKLDNVFLRRHADLINGVGEFAPQPKPQIPSPETKPQTPNISVKQSVESQHKPLPKDTGDVIANAKILSANQSRGTALGQIKSWFGLGKEAAPVQSDLRASVGQYNSEANAARIAGEDTTKFFDKQNPTSNLQFIQNIESGQKQPTPQLQTLADAFRQHFNEDYKLAQSIDPKVAYTQNYFAHSGIWADPKAAETFFNKWQTQTLGGSPAALEHRTIPTIYDGIKSGLAVKETNPSIIAINNRTALIKAKMAQEFMAKQAEKGIDPAVTQQVLDRYLNNGLKNEPLYRTAKQATYALNNIQLGLSGFHFTGTSINSSFSHLANSIQALTSGHPVLAAKNLATAPIAPILDALQGKGLRAAEKAGDMSNKYVQYAHDANLPLFKNVTYETTGLAKSLNQIKSGKVGEIAKGVAAAPFRAFSTTAKPLMEHWVPAIKAGAFKNAVDVELARLGDNVSEAEKQVAVQKAADSIDNRFGMLTQDNLFWDSKLKDMMGLLMRSPGWNIGTVREVGGGVASLLKKSTYSDLAAGKGLPANTAYSASLLAGTMMLGGTMNYMFTGKWPTSPTDYFYPRTGQTDKNGNAERVSLPTYAKDVFSFLHNPKQTVFNKANPGISEALQLGSNKDYYGNLIRNPQDSLGAQGKQLGSYLLKANSPFSLQSTNKRVDKGIGAKAESFAGFGVAPGYITKTGFQQKVEGALNQAAGSKPLTPEQVSLNDQKSQAKQAMQAGDNSQIQKLVSSGQLTAKQGDALAQSSQNTSLENQFNYLLKLDKVAAGNLIAHATPADIAKLNPADVMKAQDALALTNAKTGNTSSGGATTTAAPTSSDITSLPSGKYSASIAGTDKTFKTKGQAQTAIDYQNFQDSGKNFGYSSDGRTVFRVSAGGNPSQETKASFDYKVNSAQLTQYKNTNNVKGYLDTAQQQLKNISQQLNDPNVDPLDKLSLQNEAQTLQNNIDKYTGYSGFTKPKSGSSSGIRIKTARGSTKSSTGGSSKALASFKVANSTKSILPKGIKIKAVSYKAPKLRKISVSKIPKFSVKLRKGKQIA